MEKSPRTSKKKIARSDSVKVLIPRRAIAQRVRSLAREISREYEGTELTIVVALTGALVFLADLIRGLDLRIRIEVAQVRSYHGRATRPEEVTVTLPLSADLAGRHVLVVDDILDTGATLLALVDHIKNMKPASLAACVLLRKKRVSDAKASADFVGFDVPNRFVVGYGLDYNNLHRNLPDVCVLQRTPSGPRA